MASESKVLTCVYLLKSSHPSVQGICPIFITFSHFHKQRHCVVNSQQTSESNTARMRTSIRHEPVSKADACLSFLKYGEEERGKTEMVSFICLASLCGAWCAAASQLGPIYNPLHQDSEHHSTTLEPDPTLLSFHYDTHRCTANSIPLTPVVQTSVHTIRTLTQIAANSSCKIDLADRLT